MFEKCFMEFELDMMKNDHMYECALDNLIIKANEISMLERQGFMEESCDELFEEAGETFSQKVKEFFKNIYESIKKLVEKVKFSFEVKMKEKEVNKKLKELKKLLATNKAALVNKKVTYFNTAGYIKAYTKYIDTFVAESKKVYNKEYNSVEEFEKAVSEANKKIDELAEDLNLFDDEKWTLETSAQNAIKWTEKETENINSISKMYVDQWIGAVKEMEKQTEKEDEVTKVNGIKGFASKLTSACSKGFNKIWNSTTANIFKIMGGLSLTLGGTLATFAGATGTAGDTIGKNIGFAAGGIAATTIGPKLVKSGLVSSAKKIN